MHKLRSHKLKSKMLELDLPDYQRRKRMHGMLAGDAGAALEYLQNLQVFNLSRQLCSTKWYLVPFIYQLLVGFWYPAQGETQ